MAREPHHGAVRYYRWIWSVICTLLHRKHHVETHFRHYETHHRCEKCGREWWEDWS